MSGADYCRAKAAPPGSTLYYCLLFQSPDRQRSLLALHAFAAEIEEILKECRDPGVARAKLDFWHEELSRAGQHQARHPVGRELQALIEEDRLSLKDLQGYLGHSVAELQSLQAEDEGDFLRLLDGGAGRLWRLSAILCQPRIPQSVDAAATIGVFSHWLRGLLTLPTALQRGQLPIPRAGLAASGITPGELQTGADTPALRRLFATQIGHIREGLEQAAATVPAPDRRALVHCLILARLQASLCAEIERDHCRLLQRRYALTPIRKLWIAWRTARGA